MDRRAAILAIALAVAGLVAAGFHVTRGLLSPPATAGTESRKAAAPASAPVETDGQENVISQQVDDLEWPPVFGVTPQSGSPGAMVVKPPDPGLTLKGVIASGDRRWAILSDDNTDHVVREGDEIAPNIMVARIGTDKVELKIDGMDHSLVFSEKSPVKTARLSKSASGTSGTSPVSGQKPASGLSVEPAEIFVQGISTNDALAILRKADANRKAANGTE